LIDVIHQCKLLDIKNHAKKNCGKNGKNFRNVKYLVEPSTSEVNIAKLKKRKAN